MAREERHRNSSSFLGKPSLKHLDDVEADLQWLMSGQHTEAAEVEAAAGITRSSFRESIRQHQKKLSGILTGVSSNTHTLSTAAEDGGGSGTAQKQGEPRRSQQAQGQSGSSSRHSSSSGRHSLLTDVPPRQSQFDASSRHQASAKFGNDLAANRAASCVQQLFCKSTQSELGTQMQRPQGSRQSTKQLECDVSMQQPRASSAARYGSPGALQQECVVTVLLQQNDALQKQLQELLAANQQQAAPPTAAPASEGTASEGGAAVQQLTANERRLVKVLKKIQKDKDR